MKKMWSVAITAVLMAGMFMSGCANTSEKESVQGQDSKTISHSEDGSGQALEENEKVVIDFQQFSASSESNLAALQKMIDLYTASNPNVEVKLQTIPFNGYTDAMMAKVAAGQAPDVYELPIEYFSGFAGKDVLLDLSDMIGEAGIDTSVYNPAALEAFSMNGKQYGLPNSFSNVMLFYNKDLFDQAGVGYPTIDWTWDDVLEAARAIRSLDENVFGYYSPIAYKALYRMTAQNGGSLLNEDATAFNMTDPKVIETVEYMTDMVTEYNVMPTEAQMGGIRDWDLFAAGRLGMLVTGVWAIPDFAKNCDFNWDVEVEPGNVQKATSFFSNAYVIDKNSEVAEAALDFINFITSDPEVAKIRVEAAWELPPVTTEEVVEAYTSQTPPENRASVFEALDYMVVQPSLEQQTLIEDIVAKHLGTITTGAADVSSAMEACQKELEEKITFE